MSSKVFVDIDTQKDFMDADGALSVPGAEKIRCNLKTLSNYALANGIKIIASMDAHLKNDPEFADFPPHCVKGEPGQAKISETQVEKSYLIENKRRANVPLVEHELKTILAENDQIVLEKQTFDLFSNVNADALFDATASDECVVFGVATEYCVKAAVLSLLKRGYKVVVVEDAISAVDEKAGAEAIDEMLKAGAILSRITS